MYSEKDIVPAYVDWATRRLKDGDEPFLVTIMFNQIPGSEWTRDQVMNREVERVYAALLTRHFRNPNRVPDIRKPLWIVCSDYPVPKRHKEFFHNNAMNDGLHRHAAVLVRRGDRIKEGLSDHIKDRHLDLTATTGLIRALEARPITETPEKAFAYAFKSVLRRRAASSDMLILPRIQAEMSHFSTEERQDLKEQRRRRRTVREFYNSLPTSNCHQDDG